MSAMGGGRGSVEEFGKALRDTLDDIRMLGLGAGRAGRGLLELTGTSFALNTAMLAGQRFARDVAFGTGEDVLRFGPGQFQNALTSNALRAAAAVPMDPLQAGSLQRPIEQTFNRLGGITGPIARATGSGDAVSEETRRELVGFLKRQEFAAERDALRNQNLQLEFTGEEVQRRGGGPGSFMGMPSNPAAFFMRMFGVSAR